MTLDSLTTRSLVGFTTPESFSSCVIEFGSGVGTKKRRSLGQFNGWDVLSKSRLSQCGVPIIIWLNSGCIGIKMIDDVVVPLK